VQPKTSVEAIKLGHLGIVAKNYEEMVSYYASVVGLQVVDQSFDCTYLRCGADHHALVLYKGDRPGLHHLAFQIASGFSSAEIVKILSKAGIVASIETDVEPGIPEIISFHDFEGIRTELYVETEFPTAVQSATGISPLKLGHIVRGVEDANQACTYYQTNLGFRVSDWMEDFFVFMRCGPEHHTMSFKTGPQSSLHHIAFQVSDWAHIQRSCDILAKSNIPLIWGPLRHGIGHNIGAYHLNPDGGCVEFFCEIDVMLDERLGYFEPRPWHEENPQRPKVWKADTVLPRNLWGIVPPERGASNLPSYRLSLGSPSTPQGRKR
jgi:catechol-2,3-dioxygenase